MTQAEQYVKMCIRRWTSWGDALRSGKCGNAPWKRWREWSDRVENWWVIGWFPEKICGSDYNFKGNRYREETRYRKVKVNGKTTTISERRLVKV